MTWRCKIFLLLFFVLGVATQANSNSVDAGEKETNKLILLKALFENIIGNYRDGIDNLENLNDLSKFGAAFPAEVNYVKGYLYFNGIEYDKDIERAVEYLTASAKYNNWNAMLLLASIYSNEGEHENLTEAIRLLELLARLGVNEAKFNIFSLYKQGRYDDYLKAIKYLNEAALDGDEESAIMMSQELYDRALKSGIEEFAVKALEILESTKFINSLAYAEFMKARILGEESFSFFSEKLRDKHLQNSAKMGNQAAADLWEQYMILKSQEDNK